MVFSLVYMFVLRLFLFVDKAWLCLYYHFFVICAHFHGVFARVQYLDGVLNLGDEGEQSASYTFLVAALVDNVFCSLWSSRGDH